MFESPESCRALVFSSPATHFTASSPLGNGRLGAMIFGGVSSDRVVLNEQTLWSGRDQEADRAGARNWLPKIRELLFREEYEEAQRLMEEHFTCVGDGSNGAAYGAYETLGDLQVEFPETHDRCEDYERRLDLQSGIASVQYQSGAQRYRREVFVSRPDQAIVYRIEVDQGTFAVRARLHREQNATKSPTHEEDILSGCLDGGDGQEGVRFISRLSVNTDQGETLLEEGWLTVRNARAVTLLVTARTDYADSQYRDMERREADAAQERAFSDLRKRHEADHRIYFDRVSFELPESEVSRAATPERLACVAAGAEDLALYALYFQYGRYLLMSCSRPDSPLPANLQGLWAEEYRTPWNGDFHLNINVQMNYWAAETAHLSDCHQPLLRFIERLVPHGRKTAQVYYGARGWVAHMMTNAWLFTSPGQQASWGATNTGGAWLCQHLWEHYAFTLDRDFLRRCYPVMREAAWFYLDNLVEHPGKGWLVTAPSNSPENWFRTADGQTAAICAGPTMDQQIVRELFTNTIHAGEILGLDKDLAESLQAAMRRLPPDQVGSAGQIQEWLEDHEEVDPHHRHVSQLYGLYPSNQISRHSSPHLAAAAEETLIRRGDDSTGWSSAWKAAFWARLQRGDRAEDLLRKLLSPVSDNEISYGANGGSYANLFCAHPPFQIDGNLGGAAAIAEMLLQSHDSIVHPATQASCPLWLLLPSLPTAWHSGRVRGLCARGGGIVSLVWAEGVLRSVEITSAIGQQVMVRHSHASRWLDLPPGKLIRLHGDLTIAASEPDERLS